MQGVQGIIASLALNKALALICDIRKGRFFDVSAHLKPVRLFRSGQLHLFVSLTSKATEYRTYSVYFRVVDLGLTTFVFNAETFFQ